MSREHQESTLPEERLLKPMDIKRMARVPYDTVITWLTIGHPRAGTLASIDLAEPGKRHSFRISWADWQAFLNRLKTVPGERQQARPLPRPEANETQSKGMFRY